MARGLRILKDVGKVGHDVSIFPLRFMGNRYSIVHILP